MERVIEHGGVVERVERDAVFVRITSQSACGTCRAREACGMSEAQEKIITVLTTSAAMYTAGDAVVVGVRRRAGGLAVMLAYVGALVVLLAVLVMAIYVFGLSEGLSTLVSLSAVGFYYFCLWLARHKIENIIHFTITKQ